MIAEKNVVSFEKLVASIPSANFTEEEKAELRRRYEYLVDSMDKWAAKGKKASMRFDEFTGGPNIFTARGIVTDLGAPIKNECNFFSENTSQWLFAFGLVFNATTRSFSTHT
jgi:hypothetical protein